MTTNKLFVVLLALLLMSTSAVVVVHAQTTITIPTLTVDDFTLALIVVDAIIGSLVSAYLGWADSGEPFDAKKFSASILHAIIAAVIFVLGYSFATTVAPWDFLVIFLGSAGVDVVINRAVGAVAQKASSTTTSTSNSTKQTKDQPGEPAPSAPAKTTQS
jgi:hypothetical protein